MDWAKMVVVLLFGVVIGFGIAQYIQKDTGREISLHPDTGITKEGYYTSLEEAAKDLDTSIYFQPCRGDPNTVITVSIAENTYYELVRCTKTQKGYYCVKITSDHPTPNFVYWYSTCVGME